MNIGHIPKLSIEGVKNPFQVNMANPVSRVQPALSPDSVDKPNFQSVLSNNLQSLNEVVTAPDAMMHEAITAGSVDVHDLMIANAKAELLISITTQVATKVVQAYDKILQIQL
jgi:flagellar hook-basal body complex protein FliE